jgi:aerobic carbon-monoxide dehydrogenase medium subunit
MPWLDHGSRGGEQVKPASFGYARAESVEQVLDLLQQHGDEARVLAGGQSLIAALNLRLAAPAILIDINRLDALAGVERQGGRVRIGALTRQRALERTPEVAAALPLIAEALPHIAHPAIRNRGTIGGSLALADPAAELPACALALAADIEVTGKGGARAVPAASFFKGLYETDLAPGELLTAVTFPALGRNERSAFGELARRHGDYAVVGLAAHGRVEDGVVSDLRLAFFGVDGKPTLAESAARALDGQCIDDATLDAAGAALLSDLDPTDDVHATAATKRHLARVLMARVLRRLVGEA